MRTLRLIKCTSRLILLIAILVVENSPASTIIAQEERADSQTQAPLNYVPNVELAASLALEVGREASRLPNLSDKIEIQLEAARILTQIRPEHAAQLLDSAWTILKDVIQSTESLEADRNRALTLRGDVLALYAKVDSNRAKKLLNSLPNPTITSDETNKEALAQSSVVPAERQRADQLVKIALAKLSSNPSEGIEIAISSLKTGKISHHLSALPRAIMAAAKRSDLDAFHHKVALFLHHKTSLDVYDYRAVVYLLEADPNMPSPARSELLNFLSNSLQRMALIIREAQQGKQPLNLNASEIGYTYSIYLRSVRPQISKFAPQQIRSLDISLGEIATVVPAAWLELQYEHWTTDPAEEQLARAEKTTDRNLRDTRLMNFALRALTKRLPNSKERSLEFAATAIEAISNDEMKAILRDYLRMAEVAKLTAEKSLPQAIEKAAAISRLDWRAWMLTGIGMVQSRHSQSAALQLYEDAFRHLEKSPASPRKVELALLLAQLVSKYDSSRAFEIVTAAAKSANQIAETGVTAPTQPQNLRIFYAGVGEINFAPGQEIESLDDIELGSGIGRLARVDWIRAEQTGKAIQHLGLRLRYQLAMSKGVLTTVKAETKAADTN